MGKIGMFDFTGWGPHCWGFPVTGQWSDNVARLHINLLELRTIRYVLASFVALLKGEHLLVAIDNMTAKFYINKRRDPLSRPFCRNIWQWAIQLHIPLSVIQVVGQGQYGSRNRSWIVSQQLLPGTNIQGLGPTNHRSVCQSRGHQMCPLLFSCNIGDASNRRRFPILLVE